ncbi:MAG: Ig-like domain-containing protein [candidate division WOR-3 bacterium]
MRKTAGIFALFIMAVLACQKEEPRPTYIRIEPKTDTLSPGEGAHFKATVIDQYGDPIPGAVVNWEVSDTLVITVDSSGAVEAWNPGYAYLRASYESIKDSAFVIVKEPLGSHDIFISGRLIRTEGIGWLRLEVRQDSAGGPFLPGADVYLIRGTDTLLDTMTSASPLWAVGLPLQEGNTYRIKVLYLGRYGVDTVRMPAYGVYITQPEDGDSVSAYTDIMARWSISKPPMAKELAYYNSHDVLGYEPVYSFYTENLLDPDTGIVPGSFVAPPLGTVAVSAFDKKSFSGLGASGFMLTGVMKIARIYVQ